MEFINNILQENKIPLEIIRRKPEPENIEKNCSPDLENDKLIIFMLLNTNNNELIGFISLEKISKCILINYRCIKIKYRKYGLGNFIAFIGIYFTIENGFDAIFSMGVGDYVNAPYNRISLGKKWVLSQGLLINKFGFYDNFKKNTYSKDKIIKNMSVCGEAPETILYVKNPSNLVKYNNYLFDFINNPKTLFNKYITNMNGGNKKKDKRFGKYKHGNHTHRSKSALKKCKKN